MIGVVDYDAGNMASVANALKQIGVDFEISSDPGVLSRSSAIILPGVGAAPGAMESLNRRGLVSFLRETTQPLLGICLGMQLLFEASEEGNVACLGMIPGKILKFDSRAETIPHMGWNDARISAPDDPLLRGVKQGSFFYFANSFYAPVSPSSIATSLAGSIEFASIVRFRNLVGTQFHPEKSSSAGLAILKNFCGGAR